VPEPPPILTADSITRVGTEAAGAVVVNGSHGGIYAAYLAGKLRGGREPPPEREGAFLLVAEPPAAWALDSASLVGAEHVGTVVVTGSHGGLLGGRPDTALKYDALAALFNDAGIGIDEAGVTRLPALEARGIAAGTVAVASARIGDARSTYQDGILSRVNPRAAALGIVPGMGAREFVAITRRAAAEREGRT